VSLEGPIKKAIKEYLEARGLIVIRVQSGTAHGGRTHLAEKGTPDLVCTLPGGSTLFVEAKRSKGGKQSQPQKDFQAKAEKLGAAYVLAPSLETVTRWLDRWAAFNL
jgi:TolB-like protein